MDNNNDLIENDLILDSAILTYLKEIIVWTKILSVIGMVCSVFMLLGSVFVLFSGFMYSVLSAIITIAYLVLGIVAFYISNLLLRFTKKTKLALYTNDQKGLEDGFENLSAYFRVAAITTIVAIILSVLGIISTLVFIPFGR
jgi:hypothetical protein